MKIKSTKILFLACFLFLGVFSAISQVKNDFDVRYSADIRGELTFIANNIVNRQEDAHWEGAWVRRRGRWRWEPQHTWVPAASTSDPYDETGNSSEYNDNLNMQYIDVDSDATTFSSSSATLDIPDEGCSLVRYAGLYWSAVYVNADRSGIDDIKFQVPGGAYQDLTADEILFDGDGDINFGYYSPYACYKDVTSIVSGLANPDGDYYVANVNASSGSSISGGISGGWTMVIVYENPNLPGSKYITTFDGYAGIASAAPDVDIPVSGFTTLPAPFQVNANIAIAALEGDNKIPGDGLEINANGSFTSLSSTVNPANNFFNSNISIDPNIFTARNPNSVNTLGWDVDLFPVTNVPGNNVIPNDATSAVLRLSSTQDKYDVFFASFDVEIIEPNIVLEKKVNTPGGVDITGQGVNLGQILDYVLTFQNIGNDDADNYTIRDVLPVNVAPPNGTNFTAADMDLPPGVTYVYDAPSRTVTFSIPNNLVEQGLTPYSIRMRVQVAENCFDFIDACSDLIQNLAYSTYQGIENTAVITDDPSVTDFDACGFIVPGATNFLLDDLSDCNFSRTVELCGTEAILDAGDNFDDYVWVRDDNGNNQFDSSDTVITDGDPDNDPSTMSVTAVGTYIVDKIVADPCKGFKEIITVVPYGSGTIPNPIIEYFNDVNNDADPSNDLAGEIVQCSIDNDLLPKLFLCGVGDTRQLQVNILDAQSLVWERLDEGSCTPSGDDCANKNLTCTWTQEGTGNNYLVSSAGKYRLSVTYQNGCTSRFYFNVFQNTLDILYNNNDIICSTDGNITITNLGAGYGYQLVDDATSNILVPFSANNGPSFDFGTGENGAYRVQVTQLDNTGTPIVDACIFETPVIGIVERDVQYNVNFTPANCTVLGTATIQVTNADTNYNYEIRLDDGSNGGLGTLVDDELAQTNNNFTFTGLNPGDYIAYVNTDDGCSYSEQITIIDENDLQLEARVVQPITCEPGNILMDSSGGQAPHTYAIWEYVDEGGTTIVSYPTINDIPPSEFQTNTTFDILNPGDYTFVVVDNNSCPVFSNTVTIELRPAAEYDPVTVTDVLCFGDTNGEIQFNLTNDNGYTISYFLTDGTGTEIDTNTSGYFSGLAAGDYSVRINQVLGTASCDYTENITIGTPLAALSANSTLINDYTCIQDGIIEAQNVTGGTAPYEYSIDGVTFIPDTTPNAHRFENLTDGTYTITVRDANGCVFPTAAITLDPLNEPSDLTFTSTPPLCPAQTSDVTVTVVDGNAPFVFDIIAPGVIAASSTSGNTASFNGLAPNTYTFRVTDAKGCVYTEDFTINPIIPIAVTGQLDDNISCLGALDGAITFNVSDFTTSYDYSVTGPAAFSGTSETANAIPLTGLAAGTYSITVTDNDTNCSAIADVTVSAPPAALTIATLDVIDLTCSTSGTVPGSVTITAIDGWGGFEYELEDPVGGTVGPQSTNSFTGLTDTSGNYTVTVRDAGGCEVTQTFNLTPTVSPVLTVTANSLCYDSSTGLVLTANVTSGGEAPFQYRLNGGAYQSDVDFTGLGPGSHTIEVIDNKNCTATASIDVFPTLTANASLVKDLDCSATPDAEISIDIAGGNPVFTYEVIRDGSSVQASTAVPSIPFSYFTTTAGTYEFIISDTESCTITTNQIVVTDNNPPTVVEVITEPLCDTSADGIAELQISGGTAPYQIVFDGSAPSAQTTYAGLVAGTYNYTVTDAKGCVSNDSVTLTAPLAVTPGTINLVQDFRCDNTSATIQVVGYSGGTPGYDFSLDGVNFQGSDTFNTGITAGSYTITVRDANGCTAITPVLVVDPLDPPTDLTFSATALTCPTLVADITVAVVDGNAPFTYEIIAPAGSVVNNGNNNVFTGLAPDTYTFRVTDAKGCEIEENYTVVDIPRIGAISQLTNNVSCLGANDGAFSFTVSDFVATYSYVVTDGMSLVVQSQNNINLTTPIAVSGFAADTYTVTVTDDTTNCTTTTNMVINDPPTALDFTFTNTPVTCIENSTITVTATDGWGSYEYQLENTVGPAIVYAYQNSNTFNNVPDGTYTIYVRDAGGCVVDKPITLDPAETPTIALEPTSDFCYDGTDQASLVVNITDGVAPFTYSIDGGAQTAVIGNPFTIANLTPGTYNIQVTDAYGCVSNILTETIEPQLAATAVLTQDLLCTGNAVIDVTINGGYIPYTTYQVQFNGGGYGATTAIAGNSFTYNGAAAAGTYQFLITDTRNCTVESNEIIISPTVTPQATPVVTDVACFGGTDGSVFIDIDTNFGTAPYTVSFNGSPFTTTTTYSGLAAGNYPYVVRDSRGCEFTSNATVDEPLQILSNMVARDVTCNPGVGNNLGGIDVTITQGGFANFTYTLFDSANNIVVLGSGDPNPATTASNTHSFDGVDFGDYYVRIVDANGCESDLGSVRVLSNPYLNLTANIPPPDCPTGGTAEITASSGSGDYSFQIYGIGTPPTTELPGGPGEEIATFTGLNPGQTYIIEAIDNVNLCTSYQEVVIPPVSAITVVVDSTTDITCTSANDGIMDFTVDNYDPGVTSIDYSILNALTNTPVVGPGTYTGTIGPGPAGGPQSLTVTDLPPGDYIIYVEESILPSCSTTTTFRITEPTPVALGLISQVAANCNDDAAITVRASGGTGPYSYAYVPDGAAAPGAFPESSTFTLDPSINLDWDVYAQDANGCVSPLLDVTITEDPTPLISVTLNDQCTADEGAFSVDITLDAIGIVPHTISIDGGAPQSSTLTLVNDVMTVSNLSSGAHSFTITDANGCSETENITIYPPLDLIVNISASDNCVPANTGEITLAASGGSGNYSYTQITPAGPTQASGVFTGLTHSIAYTFEVEDTTTNCTTPVNITLPAPAVPTFSLGATDVSCFGGNDGSITVTLNPGNIDVPYEYSLDGGTTRQPSNVFTGLVQGTYNVTVISAKGCDDTLSIDVDEPTQLDISAAASAFSCNDPASTITINVNDATPGNPSGTGPYVYSFDGGVNFQTTSTFEVPFGSPNVTVVVRDANGCTDTEIVAIPAMQEVTAVINQNQAIDCNNGQEIIEIVASNGSGTYTFVELPSGNVVADPTNIVLTAPGTYVYEITDTVTDCSVIVEHTIAPYDLIDVTATVVSNATCSDSSDGVIEVTITGYTGTFDYEVFDATGTAVAGTSNSDNAISDPYVFNVASTLAAGIYTVRITETAFPECLGASNNVTIDAPEPLALTLISTVNANCNETNAIVTVQATGGTAGYNYGAAISGAGDPGVYPFDNTVELDPATSLSWDIYVQDANGCVIAVPLAITVDTDTSPDISLAIDDECASEGSFGIAVSLDAINTGVAPYTMSINGGAFQSIGSFPYNYTALASGAYTIEIRDANGCSEIENITIEPELTVSAIALTQPTCTTNDGVIEFTVNGGSGAYTAVLLLSDLTPTGIAPTGNQFTGVAFGDYIVRITDNTLGTPNCVVDAPITLEEPTPVTLLATDWTDVSCSGGSDGTITINMVPTAANVNDNPPYTFEITDGTSTWTQSTNLFTGFPVGTYDITVTSNRNCVVTDQVIISQPLALVANVTNVVPFACDATNAEQLASIEVSITTGTGTVEYFYSVNGGTFLPTGGDVFTYETNMAGSYDIVVRDANGCTVILPTEVIDPLNAFTAVVSQTTAISCAGPEEVLITVTDDGNPANNYTYELLPLGNPNGTEVPTASNVTTEFDLTAVGSYTFRVTDTTTGCYIDTAPYEIAPYDLIEVTATAIDPVICFGDGNGSLEINISGYTGTYDYQVFDSANNPIGGVVSTDTSVNPRLISGLDGGNYYVRVTETAVPFCNDDTNMVTILSPDMPLTESTTVLAEVECTNDQGELRVNPTGGVAPYDITLTNTTTAEVYDTVFDVNAAVFAGLSAGDYSVTVIDAGGCSITNNYPNLLVMPIAVTANANPLNTALSCYGDTTGTVSATNVLNGSGNYEYQLNYYDASGATIEFTSASQTSPDFINLGAGIYSITVSDGWNCDVETNQVTITEPALIEATLIRTDPLTCATGVEFELSATGGSGNYEYSLDNVTFSPMTSNPMPLPETGTLGAGPHQYFVRDLGGACVSVASNEITENAIMPLTLTVDRSAAVINCNGDATAIIYASAEGGLGNYQYELYTDVALTLASRIAGPQSLGEFTGLTAGTYYVNVTSEDCTTPAEEVIIIEPTPLTYTENVVDVSCFGDTNGSITVTLSGGSGGYQYAISPNLNQFDTINTFTDLAPGDYTVIAQDINGCFEMLDYTIGQPEMMQISATSTPEICVGEENGSITVSITGGTAPYSTSLNDMSNFVQDRVDFTDLASGSYLVFVRDAQGCEDNLIIEVAPGVNLSATVEPIYECSGDTPNNYITVTLEDPSVEGEVMYAIDSLDPSDMQLTADFTQIAPGMHTLTIAHSNGCVNQVDFEIQGFEPLTLELQNNNINEITAIATGGSGVYTFYFDGDDNGDDTSYFINRTDTFEVRVVDELGCEVMASIAMEFIDIEIPNFFTPDGDGENDFWRPRNLEGFPEILTIIFDRYGREVYRMELETEPWDGLYHNTELPTGDYWYVIKLRGENDDREFVGHFTLYR